MAKEFRAQLVAALTNILDIPAGYGPKEFSESPVQPVYDISKLPPPYVCVADGTIIAPAGGSLLWRVIDRDVRDLQVYDPSFVVNVTGGITFPLFTTFPAHCIVIFDTFRFNASGTLQVGFNFQDQDTGFSFTIATSGAGSSLTSFAHTGLQQVVEKPYGYQGRISIHATNGGGAGNVTIHCKARIYPTGQGLP